MNTNLQDEYSKTYLIRPHRMKEKGQNVFRVHFLQYGQRPQGPLVSGPYPAPMSKLMAFCSNSPILHKQSVNMREYKIIEYDSI